MRTSTFMVMAALALAAGAVPAKAQLGNVPDDVRAAIAAMGPKLDPDVVSKSSALMAPLQVPRDGLKAAKDIAYGSDPLQKLDVWRPEGASGPAPVVVFVHGGGFVRGDKSGNENIPAYFARHGYLGVSIDYRLAPKATWPAATLDLGSAVAWLKENAGRYGGDPKRIVVIGHSAGAAIVASYVFDLGIATSRDGVVGAVVISGVYGHTNERRANDNVYYGTAAAQHEPMAHVNEGKLPLLVTMTEFDPPVLASDSHELAAALCRRDGICPPFLWLSGHNHISEVGTLDTKDDRLGRAILAFVRTVAG